MKIKVMPEDFVVRERLSLPYASRGKFKIYLLTKRYWNTIDALNHISRESGVSLSLIGYAGRKDRYALTYQYLSVPKEYDLKASQPNLDISLIGFSDEEVSTKVLAGNYFEITLRKMSPEEVGTVLSRAGEVRRYGFPNYFDDQRFGSIEKADEIFAEKVVKGHYKGALKTYFTSIFPEMEKAEKERRRALAGVWGKWDEALKLCRTPIEREIIGLLMKGGSRSNLIRALGLIPKEELSIMFSAYQSLLWNLMLKRILGAYCGDLTDAPGKVMTYLFYRKLSADALSHLSKLQIPAVAAKMPPLTLEQREIIESVLSERGVKPADFNVRGLRKYYFKSFMRPALAFPHDLYVSNPEDDTVYPGYKKVNLAFFLPPGSFGTMLVKACSLAPADEEDRANWEAG